MYGKIKPLDLSLIFSLVFLTADTTLAEEGQKNPPSAASLISANGFTCSMVEGQAQCQGKFEEVDKNLVVEARGSGNLTLRVKERNDSYSYSSKNGCLCKEEKNDIECKNAEGKKEKFKGDKRMEESSAFCSPKK